MQKDSAKEEILSPEAGIKDLELADIIDSKSIQMLMDDFYKIIHFPVFILDLKGKCLAGVGWQKICTKFHRAHPETCRYCIESDIQLTSGVGEEEFKLYKCKNSMWDVATPFIVGGKKLGNVYSGQFFFDDEKIDYELFRKQALTYGFNEKEYMAALEAVPRISRKFLDEGMSFFLKLFHMISQQSYSSIKLARSLTERDNLMKSLREKEEILRTHIENSFDVIFTLDEKGTFDFISPAWERHFGYPASDGIGKSFTLFVHPEDIAPLSEYLKRVLSTIQSESSPAYRVKHSDGSWRWFICNGTPFVNTKGVLQLIGVGRDITESKKVQDELRENRQRLEFALQGGELGTWDWNPQTGGVVYGDLWAKMLEYRPDEVEPNLDFFKRHIHPEDMPAVLDRLTGHVEGRTPTYESEHRLRTKSGRWLWVMDHGKVTARDNDGRPVRVTGVIVDITERKNAEKELKKAYDEMEHRVRERTLELQQKLAELERFRNATIDREFRMKELLDEIGRLKQEKQD